ncbi:MAG: hypothetical protein ACI9MX_003366 [Candidatus Aldehydirespiratoraceae bacterium]|jgi:hypothetical protein
MKLWFFLGFLPGLPRIGALPGEADPAAPRADGQPAREGTIDHNVLRRVRALLAKALALIAEHSLAAALRDGIGETNTDGPDAIRITVERPYEREKFQLLAKIAKANRSRAILHERLGFASRIGEQLTGETKRATEEAASAAGSSVSVLPVHCSGGRPVASVCRTTLADDRIISADLATKDSPLHRYADSDPRVTATW